MKRKKAFSLIEILLALGIIFSITVISFIVYPKVIDYIHVSQYEKDIHTLLLSFDEMDRFYQSADKNDPLKKLYQDNIVNNTTIYLDDNPYSKSPLSPFLDDDIKKRYANNPEEINFTLIKDNLFGVQIDLASNEKLRNKSSCVKLFSKFKNYPYYLKFSASEYNVDKIEDIADYCAGGSYYIYVGQYGVTEVIN